MPAALPSQQDASYKGEAASGASQASPRSHISGRRGHHPSTQTEPSPKLGSSVSSSGRFCQMIQHLHRAWETGAEQAPPLSLGGEGAGGVEGGVCRPATRGRHVTLLLCPSREHPSPTEGQMPQHFEKRPPKGSAHGGAATMATRTMAKSPISGKFRFPQMLALSQLWVSAEMTLCL